MITIVPQIQVVLVKPTKALACKQMGATTGYVSNGMKGVGV